MTPLEELLIKLTEEGFTIKFEPHPANRDWMAITLTKLRFNQRVSVPKAKWKSGRVEESLIQMAKNIDKAIIGA